MILRPKFRLKLFFTCFGFCFLISFAHSQSKLDNKITVLCKNTSLINAIKSISKEGDINFTFDPSIIPNKTIFKSYQEKSVRFILNDILSGLEISFVELSGQVILYRSDEGFGFLPKKVSEPIEDSVVVEEVPKKKASPQPPEKKSQQMPDTIVINHYDTIIEVRHDTVVLIQKDTIIIEILKIDTIVLLDTSTIYDRIYNPIDQNKYKPWFSTVLLYSFQPIINYSITDTDNQLFAENLSERINISKVQGNSILAKVNAQFSRFSVQTGLGIHQLTQNFEHINESFDGYFRNDTIETYYTLQNTDTNWIYVTEENWVETSEIIRNNSMVNSYSLLIPLHFGYNARIKKFNFELSAGIITEIPLQQEISVFFDTTGLDFGVENEINNLNLKTQLPSFSYSVSLSINYLLNKNLCLVVRPYYYSNINSFYSKGQPLQQKNSCASVFIGLKYFFMNNNKNRRN